MKFSVIIPTFRRPAQLRAAAESVLSQRDVEIEIIIVDDSPERSARNVADSLMDIRVKYIANAKPSGGIPAIVRNIALPFANGEFVHFLDDDDIVPSGHYKLVKQAFVDHPDIGLVFGRIEPFGDCPPEQLEHERRFFKDAARRAVACQSLGGKWGFASEMLFGHALMVCSAAVMRRECAVALIGFDPAIRLMEDADFNIRMTREFGAFFVDTTALHYRIGSPSLMHDPSPDNRQWAEVRDCCRKFRAKYRAERGAVEFYALLFLNLTLLRIVKWRRAAGRQTRRY